MEVAAPACHAGKWGISEVWDNGFRRTGLCEHVRAQDVDGYTRGRREDLLVALGASEAPRGSLEDKVAPPPSGAPNGRGGDAAAGGDARVLQVQLVNGERSR